MKLKSWFFLYAYFLKSNSHLYISWKHFEPLNYILTFFCFVTVSRCNIYFVYPFIKETSASVYKWSRWEANPCKKIAHLLMSGTCCNQPLAYLYTKYGQTVTKKLIKMYWEKHHELNFPENLTGTNIMKKILLNTLESILKKNIKNLQYFQNFAFYIYFR